MVYNERMITVVETRPFITAAKNVLTDNEVKQVITVIALNPRCGDLVKALEASARCGWERKEKEKVAELVLFTITTTIRCPCSCSRSLRKASRSI